MANAIYKAYTAEQLFEMYRNYIVGNSDITDFNEGSVIRAIIESNAEIVSQTQMDFKIALARSIAVAIYEGFNFKKKEAIAASGFLTLRRKPSFSLSYSGAGTSAKITINGTSLIVAVIGAPADAINLDFATYPKISDLVTAIDGLSNWSAVGYDNVDSSTLFLYDDVEIIGNKTYANVNGMDVLKQTDAEILIPAGFSVTINGIVFQTTIEGLVLAGSSKTNISAQCTVTGITGNIAALGIDTANGKGVINGNVDGIQNVINFSAFSGGQIAESELLRKLRFNEAVLALNAGTERGILAEIKKIDGVINAGIRPNYPFKGINTIIVDDGSGTISSDLRAKVMKALEGDPNDFQNWPGKGTAGIGALLVVPTIVPVNVSITVYRLSRVRVSISEIITDVQSAVENYINTLQLGQPVLVSEIIKVSKNANAGVYDMVVHAPAANVSVSEQEFARTGTGTGASVTVNVVIMGA